MPRRQLAVDQPLPDMPLFLTPQFHVMVPLEKTYQSAWDAVPEYWREVMTGAGRRAVTNRVR